MDKVAKFTTATNNDYFSNGEFNFTALSDVTSIKFVAELKSKLLLNKIERISIKQFKDDSKFIYIYASHHEYINNRTTYIIFDCYYISDDYYRINYVSSNALKALALTVTQQ